jgi:hypothetical protein
VHGPFEKYAPQVGTAAGDEDSVATGVNMGETTAGDIVLRLERVGAGVGVLGENELVDRVRWATVTSASTPGAVARTGVLTHIDHRL